MQLARQWLLDRSDRTWRRKIPEVLITMHLEQKLTKKQIFEYYANQVPLGQRGSFGIRGFGEASQVFFGKDVITADGAGGRDAGGSSSSSPATPIRSAGRSGPERAATWC